MLARATQPNSPDAVKAKEITSNYRKMLSNIDADAEIQSTYILRSTVVLLFDLQSSIPTTLHSVQSILGSSVGSSNSGEEALRPPTRGIPSHPLSFRASGQSPLFESTPYTIRVWFWFWFCFYSQWKSFDSFILLHTEYSRHVSVQTPIESVLSDCPDFAIAATSHARHGVLGSWCRFHSVLAATILLQTAGLSTLLRKG